MKPKETLKLIKNCKRYKKLVKITRKKTHNLKLS